MSIDETRFHPRSWIWLAVALGFPREALAVGWGEENWGELVWGVSGLPGLGAVGLAVLAIGLSAGAFWVLRRRRRFIGSTLVLMVLMTSALVVAGTLTVPNTFTNGTIADADEVNANFDAVKTEVDDNDGRIMTLESGVVHTHPGSDITSQVSDADTVDGAHASDLSAEIDADIAIHALNASAHHTRYDDAEAVAAMLAKDDTNPLNHDRYTDGEAFSAAAGVDAGTLDGLDSLDFAAASHTHSYGFVATVAQSGGDYTDPKAAMDDLATWCGTPSATDPCLLRIMPGVYDLVSEVLKMQPYVDVAGSGENSTKITSTNGAGGVGENSATVRGADNAEIRFLTIENRGGGTNAIALFNGGNSPKITNVTLVAFGASINYGNRNNSSSSPTLTNVTITATDTGAGTVFGVQNNSSSSPNMRNVTITATSTSGTSTAVRNDSTSSPTMTNVTATATGGTNGWGVFNTTSSSPQIRNSSISGGTNSVSNNSATTDVAATLLGGAVTGGGFTCVGAFNSSFVALSTTCL